MSSRGAAKKFIRAVQLQAQRLQKHRLDFINADRLRLALHGIVCVGGTNCVEKIMKAFVKVFCGRVEADRDIGRSACAKLSRPS